MSRRMPVWSRPEAGGPSAPATDAATEPSAGGLQASSVTRAILLGLAGGAVLALLAWRQVAPSRAHDDYEPLPVELREPLPIRPAAPAPWAAPAAEPAHPAAGR